MRTAFLRRGLVACGLGLLVVAGPATEQQTIRYGFGTGAVPPAIEVSLTLPMHQSIGWYKEEGITFEPYNFSGSLAGMQALANTIDFAAVRAQAGRAQPSGKR